MEQSSTAGLWMAGDKPASSRSCQQGGSTRAGWNYWAAWGNMHLPCTHMSPAASLTCWHLDQEIWSTPGLLPECSASPALFKEPMQRKERPCFFSHLAPLKGPVRRPALTMEEESVGGVGVCSLICLCTSPPLITNGLIHIMDGTAIRSSYGLTVEVPKMLQWNVLSGTIRKHPYNSRRARYSAMESLRWYHSMLIDLRKNERLKNGSMQQVKWQSIPLPANPYNQAPEVLGFFPWIEIQMPVRVSFSLPGSCSRLQKVPVPSLLAFTESNEVHPFS